MIPHTIDRRHTEVAEGVGLAAGSSVAVLDTSHVQKLLGDKGGNEAGTTGSGDDAEENGAALAGNLGGDGVGISDLVTPVAAANGEDVDLGINDGTTHGNGDFASALDTETEMAVVVTNSDDGLEAGALTGGSLLLDGGDLHDLVLESGAEKVVDNLALLDGQTVQVDVLDVGNLAILHKASELGDGHPLLLLAVLAASAACSTAVATSATVTASASTALTESSLESFTGWCSSCLIRHILQMKRIRTLAMHARGLLLWHCTHEHRSACEMPQREWRERRARCATHVIKKTDSTCVWGKEGRRGLFLFGLQTSHVLFTSSHLNNSNGRRASAPAVVLTLHPAAERAHRALAEAPWKAHGSRRANVSWRPGYQRHSHPCRRKRAAREVHKKSHYAQKLRGIKYVGLTVVIVSDQLIYAIQGQAVLQAAFPREGPA